MTIHCNGSSKAILEISSPEKLIYTFNKPPLTVTLNELINETILASSSSNYGVVQGQHPSWGTPINPAQWIWNTANAHIDAPEGVVSFSGSFTTSTSSLCSVTCAVDNIGTITVNGNLLGNIPGYAGFGTLHFQSQAGINNFTFNCENILIDGNNPAGLWFLFKSENNSYTLNASDLEASFSRTYIQKPAYTVRCDDGCPEGYCKCETIEYPGYCCLPCKPTAQQIANLAEKIKV